MSRTFSTNEVAGIWGLTPRKLQSLDEKGVVSPKHRRGSQSGRIDARAYTETDCILVGIVGAIKDAGITGRLKVLREMAKTIRPAIDNRSAAYLAIAEHKVKLINQEEDLIRFLLAKARPVLVLSTWMFRDGALWCKAKKGGAAA